MSDFICDCFIKSVKAFWGSPDQNKSMLSLSFNTRTQHRHTGVPRSLELPPSVKVLLVSSPSLKP